MLPPDWHYPRHAFTHDVFLTLTRGPVPALSLFGPRRTGKTEFLQRDLAQKADSHRHRVVYASFWQTTAAPLSLLLYACDSALRPQTYAQRLVDWARNPPIKVSLSALRTEVEVDLGRPDSSAPEDDLLLLDQYLDRLAEPRRPTLLLLDEVQELAANSQGGQIMAGLRTSLDRRRDGLRTVFTGSSQIGLNKVFSSRDAPLYRFATPLDLPPLDEDFVDHQLGVFRKVYRRSIDRAVAVDFFHRFQRNPMFFQRWLTTLGLQSSLTAGEAAERTAAELADTLDFDRKWRELPTSHRAMARVLAERVDEPFGETGARRFAELAGTEAPIPQSRQSYVRTLVRRGIVDQWDGDWRIADPVFERWILERDRNAF